MCLGRAGGSGGAFARSESIGSGWRTFGHWSNNSSWYPAAARRPPQSDMWKRVPQTPHCLARSEFPRESEPPHLWHVPRAASFPIKSGPGIVTSGLPGREVGPNICPTPFLRPVHVTARLAKCAPVGASLPCPSALNRMRGSLQIDEKERRYFFWLKERIPRDGFFNPRWSQMCHLGNLSVALIKKKSNEKYPSRANNAVELSDAKNTD